MPRVQRVAGLPPYPRTSLDEPIAVYVVAADGVTAGTIIHALEREALTLRAAWGPLDDLAGPEWELLDLVVVVEPDRGAHSDSQYSELRRTLPRATIAVICSADRVRPQALLLAGVDGIIMDPGADAVVGPAVRTIMTGYVAVPRALRAALQPPPLTKRERQILELVVEGLTNREIAERLYLAESTVKRHLSSTFRRLGVSSRHEAAAAVLAAEQSFGVGGRGAAPPTS
jgi:DNA-binding NarL/FixJ family response regulator